MFYIFLQRACLGQFCFKEKLGENLFTIEHIEEFRTTPSQSCDKLGRPILTKLIGKITFI